MKVTAKKGNKCVKIKYIKYKDYDIFVEKISTPEKDEYKITIER